MEKLQELTVMELKKQLRQCDLPSTGSKSELISRLITAFPDGKIPGVSAISVDVEDSEEVMTDATARDAMAQNPTPSYDVDTLRRELELLRRENDLSQRELRVARRENEILRNSPRSDTTTQSVRTSVTVKAIGELLPDFDGSNGTFRRWRKQAELLRTTYGLEDSSSRILIGSKLKGKVAAWFQSRSEHLELTFEELLDAMAKMYDDRPSRQELRRTFEQRKWKSPETFSDYVHDKVVLANEVPITDEEEIVDCIVDGITDLQLQRQARMHNFDTVSALTRAFKKLPVPVEEKPRTKSDGPTTDQPPARGARRFEKDDSARRTMRCYNCNAFGHAFKDCKQPKREKGTCYGCGEVDHKVQACPKKELGINHVRISDEDDFRKNVTYNIISSGTRQAFTLDTLIDTGSPISFIKEQFVQVKERNSVNNPTVYYGINNSKLVPSGKISANVTLDGATVNDFRLHTVPNNTMLTAVVLGRDALKLFGLTLSKRANDLDSAVQDILNISVNELSNDPIDDLVVNPGITHEEPEKVNSPDTKCLKCIPHNPTSGRKEGFMRSIPKGDKPIGKSRPLKRHIPAAIDSLTKHARLYATKTAVKLEASRIHDENYCNKRRKKPFEYEVGNLVVIRNFESTPGVPKKLIPRFKGPYEIVKKLRNDRYVIADEEGFQNTQKRYQGVWEPANMRPWQTSHTKADQSVP